MISASSPFVYEMSEQARERSRTSAVTEDTADDRNVAPADRWSSACRDYTL